MSAPARRLPVSLLTLVALSGALLAGCGGGGEAADSSTPATGSSAAAAPTTPTPSTPAAEDGDPETGEDSAVPGRYVDLAEYDADPAAYADSQVVLFFHASWCPDCRATDDSLTTDGVPAGVTVVKVDFDTETDLRRTYGVTVQHTFVAVESDGNQVKKWTGTFSGQAIADQLA